MLSGWSANMASMALCLTKFDLMMTPSRSRTTTGFPLISRFRRDLKCLLFGEFCASRERLVLARLGACPTLARVFDRFVLSRKKDLQQFAVDRPASHSVPDAGRLNPARSRFEPANANTLEIRLEPPFQAVD